MIERLSLAFQRVTEAAFVLAPIAMALAIWTYQVPPQVIHAHLLHEVVIALATGLGLFVSLITLLCYRNTGETFAYHLILGVGGFTVIYLFHGLLTRTEAHGMWFFILFGPTSRLVFTLFLMLGVLNYDKPDIPDWKRFRFRRWRGPLVLILLSIPATLLLAYTPAAGHFAVRGTIEGASILCGLVAILVLARRKTPFAMKWYLLVCLTLCIQSSATFLMAQAWTHLWWFAHIIFAAGFLVLSYGIVRSYRFTRSLSALYSEEEMLARLTRSREVQKTLRQARDEALAASRSKTEFLATMSHELRTPLNAIIGFSETMQSQILGPMENETYREYSHLINQSGQHLLGMIENILDVSRLDDGTVTLKNEDIAPGSAIKTALDTLGEQALAADIRLEVNVPQTLPHLIADKLRLTQVFINIIGNAIKFSARGGTVTVTASRRSDGGLDVAVKDTGIGMNPADVPKALEMFSQLDSRLERRYEGAGIGLSLAMTLMKLHGGDLSIDTAPGMGTTVTLTFPAERIRSEATAA